MDQAEAASRRRVFRLYRLRLAKSVLVVTVRDDAYSVADVLAEPMHEDFSRSFRAKNDVRRPDSHFSFYSQASCAHRGVTRILRPRIRICLDHGIPHVGNPRDPGPRVQPRSDYVRGSDRVGRPDDPRPVFANEFEACAIREGLPGLPAVRDGKPSWIPPENREVARGVKRERSANGNAGGDVTQVSELNTLICTFSDSQHYR